MKRLKLTVALTAALATLAACGDTVEQRAISGGAIGAGAGALGARATGQSTTSGALLGAAAGAAAGAVTNESDIYFGKFPFE